MNMAWVWVIALSEGCRQCWVYAISLSWVMSVHSIYEHGEWSIDKCQLKPYITQPILLWPTLATSKEIWQGLPSWKFNIGFLYVILATWILLYLHPSIMKIFCATSQWQKRVFRKKCRAVWQSGCSSNSSPFLQQFVMQLWHPNDRPTPESSTAESKWYGNSYIVWSVPNLLLCNSDSLGSFSIYTREFLLLPSFNNSKVRGSRSDGQLAFSHFAGSPAPAQCPLRMWPTFRRLMMVVAAFLCLHPLLSTAISACCLCMLQKIVAARQFCRKRDPLILTKNGYFVTRNEC